jgi:WD40 repeat protein
VWDWAARKPTYTVSGRVEWGGLISLAFSPDGRSLATGTFAGPVLLWDAVTGQPRSTFHAHRSAVKEVTFSPDSRTLAVVHVDGTLVVWELLTGKPRLQVRLGASAVSVAFAPNGCLLAVGGPQGVCVYDPWTAPNRSLPDGAVWDDLGSSEPRVAFRAMRLLVLLPNTAWSEFQSRSLDRWPVLKPSTG